MPGAWKEGELSRNGRESRIHEIRLLQKRINEEIRQRATNPYNGDVIGVGLRVANEILGKRRRELTAMNALPDEAPKGATA